MIDDDRRKRRPETAIVGWREWVALPDLAIVATKAKFDTGARTSSLHTSHIESVVDDGRERVRFVVHPLQRRQDVEITCEADVVDRRRITDSGGHSEMRIIIQTTLRLGADQWPIELSLTNRDTMTYRLLLGRTAMRGRLMVDPACSYTMGKELIKKVERQIGRRKRGTRGSRKR